MNKKILVIKTRAMGDTVLSTASLNALREQNPNCEIHFLAPKIWLPLLHNHPAVDKIIPFTKKSTWALIKLVFKLRNENYDTVIALHAANTSANIARFSGAKNRAIHFHGINDTNKFSTVEIPGKGEIKPIIERDLDALRALGLKIDKAETSLHVTEEEFAWAKKWLQDKDLNPPLLTLALGASRPTKIWPLEKFVEVAKTWIEKKRGSVLVIVGPNEEKFLEPFKDLKNIDFRVGGDLRENMALIQSSDAFVGNDSGPKHMAVALGVPTITLFGPESPFEWHPYDRKNHKVVHIENLDCRKSLAPGLPAWCGIAHCEEFNHRCMKEIAADKVTEILLNN